MSALDLALAIPFAAALVLIVRDMRRKLRARYPSRRRGDSLIWQALMDFPLR